MLDKIAKAERWGMEESGSSSGVDALQRIAEAIEPGKLKMDLTIRPVDPAEQAVDVTPRS